MLGNIGMLAEAADTIEELKKLIENIEVTYYFKGALDNLNLQDFSQFVNHFKQRKTKITKLLKKNF